MADAPSKPVWFITGCSTGFGRELSKILLSRGYRVVVTARDKAKVDDLVRDHAEKALALKLDVEKQAEIEAAVEAARRRFGRIDVLVNNAGYGYLAAIEEGDDADIRAVFETNVFGLAALTSRRAADHAGAKVGRDRQRLLDGWIHRFSRLGLLRGDQIRCRRDV